MARPIQPVVLTVAMGVSLTLLGACAGRAPGGSRAYDPRGAGSAERAREQTERLRQQRRLERRIEIAQLRLAQCQIADEHEALRYRQRLARAEKEFELARRRVEIFNEMTIPNRLARAELLLQRAEDDLVEAREELERLQGACSAEESLTAQQAAGLEHARRVVERRQREAEIQREELRLLREVLLPLEAMELQLESDRRKQAVLELHWDNESAMLDRRMALLEAEEEVERLENELADLMRQVEGQAQQAGAASDTQPAGATDSATQAGRTP